MAQQTIVIEVPGTPISELEQTSHVQAHDVLPVVQNDETKKAPLQQIAELVTSGLGSAALKNIDDFATPAEVSEVAKTTQQGLDATNERVDNVEFGLTAIGEGADASFATYAEMIAYVPPKANVSVRNNDPDPDLRGVYIWTGTKYIDGYDSLTEAEKLAEQKAAESRELIQQVAREVAKLIFSSSNKNSLFDFADRNGSIVLQIGIDGKINVVGFEKDLVSHIKSSFDYIKSKFLFVLLDAAGNFILTVDKESKVWIVGVNTDLASAINSKSDTGVAVEDTSNLAHYSYRDSFIPKAQNLLNFFRNNQNVGLLAPVPLQWTFQNFSIGMNWIDQAKISNWGNYIPVNTPYGPDRGVVHPHILEFPNKFLGYRYIVTITGYTNGVTAEENPFLLGSNDLQSFDLLTDLIDQPDSYTWEHGTVYNSDPFTFYDVKTGELCLMFRTYWADTDNIAPNLTYEKLYIRRTKDGKVWSEREVLFENYTGLALAPAIIYDAKNDIYHLYVMGNTNGNASGLQHFTSKTLKNDWSYVGKCNTPATDSPWHADLKIVGDKVVCTYQNRVGSDSIGFRLGISDDFHNFSWASDWWNPPTYEVYKASFLPQFNELNKMRLVYIWTTNHKPAAPLNYKLFVQSTEYFDVEFSEL